MSYIELPDGSKHWKYDHVPETTGDPLRVAGEWLAHNVEAFLFDYNHPGFQNSAFLSWCLAHFDALRAGTVPHSLMWDAKAAGVKPPISKGSPRGSADIGIRYPDGAIEADHIDTSPDVPSVAEHYDRNEVPASWMARYVNAEPTVVPPKHFDGAVTGVANDPEDDAAETPAETTPPAMSDGTPFADPDPLTSLDVATDADPFAGHVAKEGDE